MIVESEVGARSEGRSQLTVRLNEALNHLFSSTPSLYLLLAITAL
jgi:hypothetical protein